MSEYFVVRTVKCPQCEGGGTTLEHFGYTNPVTGRWERNERDVTCTQCNGTGKVLEQIPLADALEELGVAVKVKK